MLTTLDRYTDDDIAIHGADAVVVRNFATRWREELTNRLEPT